jgi:hypothetical protein
MAERVAQLQALQEAGTADLCPDLTEELLAYLEARYILPTFSGNPSDHPAYQRDVGRWELVVDLRAHFEAYSNGKE